MLRNPDTGLIPAVGITAANMPEATVTGDIATDLAAAGMRLAELHIDRARPDGSSQPQVSGMKR